MGQVDFFTKLLMPLTGAFHGLRQPLALFLQTAERWGTEVLPGEVRADPDLW
jgi:hypothetical protein